jgi:hypothetical protein
VSSTLIAISLSGISNRIRFWFAVNTATGALTLTHRSFISGSLPRAIACAPDASRVFVAHYNQISCIDVKSGAVRSFLAVAEAGALVHGDCLSVVHAESGAVQSTVKALRGRSWDSAKDIAVLPDFICIADFHSHCVHVIPRSDIDGTR